MTSSAMLVPGKALELVNHVKLHPLEPRFCGRARGGLQGTADQEGVAQGDVLVGLVGDVDAVVDFVSRLAQVAEVEGGQHSFPLQADEGVAEVDVALLLGLPEL